MEPKTVKEKKIKPDLEKNKNIIHELDEYPLPIEIKARCNEIYNKMTLIHTKRGNKRKQMLYFLIYTSYRELGDPMPPETIANLVGLNRNKIKEANRNFGPIHSGYKSEITEISIVSLIPNICKNLGFDNDRVEDCVNMAKEMVDKKPSLEEEDIQKVASAMVQYYLIFNGISFDKKEFSRISNVSSTSLNTMVNMVGKLHNE